MDKLISSFILIFLNDILIYLLSFFAFCYLFSKNKFFFLKLILSFIFTFIFIYLIKNLVFLNRPYQLINHAPPIIFIPSDSTFPSAHAAYASTLATTFYFYQKKLGIVFFILALIIGLARILAHVHYPIDVIFGLCLGAFIALLVHFALKSKLKSLDF